MVNSEPKQFNNIVTKCFGSPSWYTMEIFAMGYPLKNPTRKQQTDYRRFYKSFGDTLPCNLCRDSFKIFLKEIPLTNKVLSGRKELVFWVFKIHNRVNEKLSCKQFTRSDMEKKYKWYEQFRAKNCSKELGGCVTGAKKIKKCVEIKIVPESKHNFRKLTTTRIKNALKLK
jgi:hypothetical protein